jgi:hypothetical protein
VKLDHIAEFDDAARNILNDDGVVLFGLQPDIPDFRAESHWSRTTD